MKKVVSFLLVVLALVPSLAFAKEKKMVKVYVFEAGGCPYCEMQIKYLKELDSYNKKFEIVEKEAYVDHVDWAAGKDYNLTKTVAEAFKKAGFEDASYQGTPFVVISDKYAAAAYSESLESIINEAYEEGDKDIVSCFENGKTDCLKHLMEKGTGSSVDTNRIILWNAVFSAITIASVGVMIYVNNKKMAKLLESKVKVKNYVQPVEKREELKNVEANKSKTKKSKKK